MGQYWGKTPKGATSKACAVWHSICKGNLCGSTYATPTPKHCGTVYARQMYRHNIDTTQVGLCKYDANKFVCLNYMVAHYMHTMNGLQYIYVIQRINQIHFVMIL